LGTRGQPELQGVFNLQEHEAMDMMR